MSNMNIISKMNAKHRRPHNHLIAALCARADNTLTVNDVLTVFDSIAQRADKTALRDQTGKVSAYMCDAKKYDLAQIESIRDGKRVIAYRLMNASMFNDRGFNTSLFPASYHDSINAYADAIISPVDTMIEDETIIDDASVSHDDIDVSSHETDEANALYSETVDNFVATVKTPARKNGKFVKRETIAA